MKSITVVSVDDHHLLRTGIRSHIEKDNGIVLVGEGNCGKDAYNLVEQYRPDVLLLDINMLEDANNPQAGQFQIVRAIRAIKRQSSHTAVIIVSGHISHTLVEVALSRGVQGYVLKSDELTNALAQGIRIVHAGGTYFSRILFDKMTESDSHIDGEIITARQKQIILAIAEQPNLSSTQHAANFGITDGALRNRLSELFKRLEVNNITACILECIKRGIITIPDI